MLFGILFKRKKDININEFGEFLEKIRRDKGMEIWDLSFALKQKGIEVEEKKIRKWEKGLDFPNLETIYKLSEIYKIPSSQFLMIKEETLINGYSGIDVYMVKLIGYIMGVSIYTVIWGTRIILGLMLIYAYWKFWAAGEAVYQKYLQTGKPVI